MKIYIVRHGETNSNKAKKLMGQRINESLNANGVHQARKLADDLKEKNFDIIFSSPLKRAFETAQIIADVIKVPVIKKKELTERDFGSLSGDSWDEISAITNIDAKATDFSQSYDYRQYGGERAEDVKKRFLLFVGELKKDYKNKKILIVAHEGILKLAYFLFNKEEMNNIPENASIYEFNI